MGWIDSLKKLNLFASSPSINTTGFSQVQTPSIDPCNDPAYMNSAVMSLLNWTVNQFGQASLETYKRKEGSDQDEIELNSDAAIAWREGHPEHGRDQVENGLILSLVVEGTSFLFKVRNGQRKIVGYQWLPHYDCTLRGDGTLIYAPPGTGKMYTIPRSEYIINTIGVDPEDPRLGYSPLKAALQEVLTDQEAAQYSRAVIRNFGVIGGIISPPSSKDLVAQSMSDMHEKSVRRMFGGTTGENRGSFIVSPVPLQFQQITATPEHMALEKVRRIPEERISAVFNVPAVVLGLGAGLENSTYNNVQEARKAAWDNYLIPVQDRVARQWNKQMLHEFEVDPSMYLAWDRRHVEALQEDRDQLTKRYLDIWKADGIKRNTLLRALDLTEAPAEEDIYFSQSTRMNAEAEAKANLVKRINGNRDNSDG